MSRRVLVLPRLRPYQTPVLLSPARDDLTISAPQLGKTIVGGAWLLSAAWCAGRSTEPWWWAAPTWGMAADGYRKLVGMGRSAGVIATATSQPPLVAILVNGARIEARSWERPENLYGPTVRGGVIDEFGSLTSDAYAAISSRRAETVGRGEGKFRYLGNVGELGGVAEELWRMAEAGASGFACRRWTWRDRARAHACPCGAGIELERIREHRPSCTRRVYLEFIAQECSRMSAPQFRSLYEAEWIDANVLPVYAEFDRALHVDRDLRLDPFLPIELGCDFNVDPMVWIVGQHKGEEAWIVDEIVIPGGATTVSACQEFLRRYPGALERELLVFGDSSGNARKTSASRTDYDTMRKILGAAYPRLQMRQGSANPPVTDRVNAVNAKLKAADGRVRLWVHPKCKTAIADLARVSWKPGTREIDKSVKTLTHASDALGYWIWGTRSLGGRQIRGGAWAVDPRRSDNPAFAPWIG